MLILRTPFRLFSTFALNKKFLGFSFQPEDGVTVSLERSSSPILLSCLVPMSASNQLYVNNQIKTDKLVRILRH